MVFNDKTEYPEFTYDGGDCCWNTSATIVIMTLRLLFKSKCDWR